ncbi:hypothetical protein BV898_08932 [Hypsibius exemplaris]|uniref:CAS1 domain-containing protein 1 n=1 Tax=Hypsibius exemplaris TaxID=2072580 RepID=A0A1W0WNX4_HYPEX|nr:hypothetical protein BV898_08932 [Hypsibius exemplaris]
MYAAACEKTEKQQIVENPDQCTLKIYSQSELVQCMQERTRSKHGVLTKFLFIGDSRIRQLRDEVTRQLTGKDNDCHTNPNITTSMYHKQSNRPTILEDSSVRIEFSWAGGLDDGRPKGNPSSKETEAALRRLSKQSPMQLPDIVVLGNGAWNVYECFLKNRSQDVCLQDYKRAFHKLLPMLRKVAERTPVIWAPQIMMNGRPMWPREHTDQNYVRYNDVVRSGLQEDSSVDRKRSGRDKVLYWESTVMVSKQLNDSADGLHYAPLSKYFSIQMLFNFLCNLKLQNQEDAAGLCCRSKH